MDKTPKKMEDQDRDFSVKHLIFVVLLFSIPFVVVIALWKLLLGDKGIRNRQKNVETSIARYRHCITGREVVLVSTIHIGELEYFATIQNIIDSLPRHRVLYERVRRITPEENFSLTGGQRRTLRYHKEMFQGIDEIAKVMSLQHQREGLAYDRPGWVNTDISMFELIQLLPTKKTVVLRSLAEFLIDEENKQLLVWSLNKALGHFVLLHSIASLAALFSSEVRREKKAILDTRNDIAVSGIMRYVKYGDVITIWGAGHTKGIDKQLRCHGFKEVERQWLTAYRYRQIALSDLF